jgi:hypothetical protein
MGETGRKEIECDSEHDRTAMKMLLKIGLAACIVTTAAWAEVSAIGNMEVKDILASFMSRQLTGLLHNLSPN